MAFTGINIQGNIISAEIIEKVRQEDSSFFQKPSDFKLPKNVTVRDEINVVWSSVRSYWEAFRIRRERLAADESGTAETRQGWMIPFLSELGYELDYQRKAEIINDKTYPISHRAINHGDFPIHIAGINQSLDKRSDTGGMRLSPHALVQEYLNNHSHLYAIVTNGRSLRVLRDATRLSRLSYLEFDLERIMEESLFNEFALLFRLLHVTRMPENMESGEDSTIEFYHQESLASGSRIREKLSIAVEQAITLLANGFFEHPGNESLRKAVADLSLQPGEHYLFLLRTVYRILFLMVIEERNLIFPDKRDAQTDRFRNLYYSYFSLKRLRELSMVSLYVDAAQNDLWEGLKMTFRFFEDETAGSKLGIKPLGSGLFDPDALGALGNVKLSNATFLKVLKTLSVFTNENGQQVAVNYGDLDVEEFGSVYEGLLEYDAQVSMISGTPVFSFVKGTGRSSSGSHYTPEELVKPLIQHSLDYLISDCITKPETRLTQVSSTGSEEVAGPGRNIKLSGSHDLIRPGSYGVVKQDGGANKKSLQERALLSLKVADVACGSGHILLSAARRIALELARVRTAEDQPSPSANRQALRDVIKNCLYGVDKNPLAIELCKVALWLESHSPGEPLGFLDHHIKCGDSIVGLAHREELENGIPDEAFKTLPGDDKEVASAFLRKNRAERKLRERKDSGVQLTTDAMENSVQESMTEYHTLSIMPESTPEDIRSKDKAYRKFLNSKGYTWLKIMADTQVAQFFIPKTAENKDRLVTDAEFRTMLRGYAGWQNRQTAFAATVAQKYRFFHWFLEFPEIFHKGGFDCVVGNPPFLGGKKISTEYGAEYNHWIKSIWQEKASSDLVGFFFRRIFDVINECGFQSLISTNTISQGDTREVSLDYIVRNNGKIIFAIKSTKWPGIAAVEVSLVSITKNVWERPAFLNKIKVKYISSLFEDVVDIGNPFSLKENSNKSFKGVYVFGPGFILSKEEASLLRKLDIRNDQVIFPYLIGEDFNSTPLCNAQREIINFFDWSEEKAKEYTECFKIVEERVRPQRDNFIRTSNQIHEYDFWKYWDKRPNLYNTIKDLDKVLVSCTVTRHLSLGFVNTNQVFDIALNVLAYNKYKSFSFFQSTLHASWAWKYGSTMKNDLRYTPQNCIETFPIPQINIKIELELEKIGSIYHEHRRQLMLKMRLGLTKTYNAFHAPEVKSGITMVELHGKDKKVIEKQHGKEVWNLWNHLQKNPDTCSIEEAIAGIVRLRELHVEMDNAVLEAYGWSNTAVSHPGSGGVARAAGGGSIDLRHEFYEVDYLPENDRIRFTIHPDARREVLKRLLELNHQINEEEVKSGLWDKNKSKEKTIKEQKTKDKRLAIDETDDGEVSYNMEEEVELPIAADEPHIPAFEPGTLFHATPINRPVATQNCRVVIRDQSGHLFKLHIFPNAEKDHYTGEYRQIKPSSPMAEQIIGKGEGEGFEFGGMKYYIEYLNMTD